MIKRGQYVMMPYDENVHIVVRVNRLGGYVLHRVDKPYSKKYLININRDHVREASILNIKVSRDFLQHIKNMWELKGDFDFETKLLKSWDLAANFQYDFIHLSTNAEEDTHVFISYKHINRIRRSKIKELVPGRKLTDYEYLHKFKCEKLWKINSRAILCASR